MPVRRIKVKAAAADDALVAEVERCLRGGKLVALPTETVYGIAADPDDPAAVARLRRFKGRAEQPPFTHHLASPQLLGALAPPPPRRVQRLLSRFWPGPVTLVLPGHDGNAVGVRVPAHPFTAAVLARFPRGLFLSSANRSGEPPAIAPDEIAAALPALDVLVDAGPPALGTPSAVVRCTGGDLEVLREGTLSRDELLRAAAFTVLFVCSGNTCRSPLAEAIARRRAAALLGVAEGGLLARGLRFASAGTSTFDDMPASEHAVAAAREIDLDLRHHRSHALTATDVDEAALLYALSQAHLRRARELALDLGERGQLLDPKGRDVADPFGGELADYRRVRDAIAAAVGQRLVAVEALLRG